MSGQIRASERSGFSAETWVAWIVATATAGITMASYVHANFKTLRQDEADKVERAQFREQVLNSLDKRLERIEHSLDELKQRR